MDVSDAMQRQAKALGDPSRFRLFRYIADATEPAGVAELTALLGFNHNAIRQHLAVLVEAGLVAESDERRAVRGRPRKLYTLRADALDAFGSVSGSYERLAELLLEVVTTDDAPYDIGFRAASVETVERARDLARAVDNLVRHLADGGFEPSPTERGAIELLNCPFAGVASKDPAVVCELHRGLIDGYLSAQSPGLVGDLRLRDPQKGGCRVKVGGPARDGDSIPVPVTP